MREEAALRKAEQANQHVRDNQVQHRSDAERGERLIGRRVDIARDF